MWTLPCSICTKTPKHPGLGGLVSLLAHCKTTNPSSSLLRRTKVQSPTFPQKPPSPWDTAKKTFTRLLANTASPCMKFLCISWLVLVFPSALRFSSESQIVFVGSIRWNFGYHIQKMCHCVKQVGPGRGLWESELTNEEISFSEIIYQSVYPFSALFISSLA